MPKLTSKPRVKAKPNNQRKARKKTVYLDEANGFFVTDSLFMVSQDALFHIALLFLLHKQNG